MSNCHQTNESLTFLLSDLSRIMRREFNERARDIGVTRTQWRVLTLLARNEGCNQGMLADLLEVEPITVARMVDRLQDAGLVERRADPNDRRAWLLFLTPQAREIVVQLRSLIDALSSEVMQGISPDAAAQLRATLETMRSNATQISENHAAAMFHLKPNTATKSKSSSPKPSRPSSNRTIVTKDSAHG